jgi:signal transduction histidine kinase
MPASYLPQARADRLIAAARLVIALFTMLAVWLDPDLGSGRMRLLLAAAAVIFALYAIGLALVAGRALLSDRARLSIHVLDFLVYSVLIELTQAPFVFFIFWIVCGLLRFGTRGAVVTASIATAAYFVLTVSSPQFPRAPGLLVLRFASLIAVSVLVVGFGAYERRVRTELAEIASWPQTTSGSREALVAETLRVARELMHAAIAAVYWEELEEPWVWFASSREEGFVLTREGPELAATIIGAEAADATFLCDWSRGRTTFKADGRGPIVTKSPLITTEVRNRLDLGTAAVSSVVKSDLVQGRLIFGFLRDATIDDMPLSDVIARLVAARLDHAASAERMRDSAVGEERLRVARDLHDGLLQSLTGAALQLESLHRLIGSDDNTARARVRSVQQVLEIDQRELRSFITQLRPEPAMPRSASLRARLDTLATRFERQWNVAVKIEVEPPSPALSESLAAEIYNIVNEAVANSAKHAGGTKIDVKVCVGPDVVVITVQDDGRGFPFHGTYDLAALDELKRGPVTLKERIASLKGDLRLVSSAEGTRLEVTLAL